MTEINQLLLHFGPLVLLVATVIAAFGLPAPASLALVAAGALTGVANAPFAPLFAAGLVGTIAGDHLTYWLAAKASGRVHRMRIGRHLGRAETALDRWGAVHVFLSRFVFPTVLTPATNYFCGLSRYPLRRFTPAVVLGECVYVGGYMWLGQTFSTQVTQINAAAAKASLLMLDVLVGLYCLFVLIHAIAERDEAEL